MQGYIFALMSGVAAGATVAVGKLVSPSLPSLIYVLLLTAFSGCMTLFWMQIQREPLQKIPAGVLKSFLGHVACSFVAIWTFWQGTKLMEAAVASFSVRIELVFVLIFSWFFFRERLKSSEFFGAVVVVVGTSLMGLDFGAASRSEFFRMESLTSNGGLLMLISGAAFAGAEVFAKNLSLRIEPASLVVWRSLGLIVCYLCAILLSGSRWITPDAKDLIYIAIAGLLGPVLARIWFMESIRRTTLGRASLLAQIEPVVTLAVAWVLSGESAALSDGIGAGLILFGCILLHL